MIVDVLVFIVIVVVMNVVFVGAIAAATALAGVAFGSALVFCISQCNIHDFHLVNAFRSKLRLSEVQTTEHVVSSISMIYT